MKAKIVKLKSFIAQCNGFNKENRNKVFDLIDSIKFGHVWKPSIEQIKVCKEVYADLLSAKGFNLGTVNGELNRLEEELKKLS